MSAMKTPLQIRKEQHGEKDKLVEKVVEVLEIREDESKDDLRQRLRSTSNKKLMRLLRISETVGKKYGSSENLGQEVANALGRGKDADYVRKLSGYSPARLLSLAEGQARKARRKST